MGHIKTLTGLRGLAALIVFISHSANEGLLPIIFGNGFGQIGVIIFFILSGFLMSHLYLHEKYIKNNIKKYIIARVGRVFPLYLTLIFISLFIVYFIDSSFYYHFNSKISVIQSVFFISAPYVFWTIPVEVQFYGFFLVFWFGIQKKVSTFALLSGMILMALPSIFYYFTNGSTPKWISTYSFVFFIGALTSLNFDTIKNSKYINQLFSPKVAFVLFLLLFINLPELRVRYALTFADDFFIRTWLDPITWVIVYSLFICAILNSSGLSFLNSQFFTVLGNISYGFYLIHYPILMYMKSIDLSSISKFFLAFIITFTISYISNKYFETFANKKIRQLLS
jgi:peptidoglycan/LPS O-acetylase OafA/YrhL